MHTECRQSGGGGPFGAADAGAALEFAFATTPSPDEGGLGLGGLLVVSASASSRDAATFALAFAECLLRERALSIGRLGSFGAILPEAVYFS